MVGAMIALFIFLGLIGGMVFMVSKTLKKTDPSRQDTSTIDNITTAQDFLPFEDIKDGMMILGADKYRAVIECSSTNYYLKTDKEKEIIEISFQRFLNSLTFPIVFYIQTKIMDNSKMLLSLKEELLETINQFPHLEDYANIYYNEMNNLDVNIGNNKQKKKYVIVPYEEALTLEKLSKEEKYDYSCKELYTRASILVDGLSAVGVKAKILDTKELIELVYSHYHKDNHTQVESLLSGEFLSLMTEAENKAVNMNDDAKIDVILYEAQMKIQNQMLYQDLPPFIRQNCEKSLKALDKLRDEMEAYFKEAPPVQFEDAVDESDFKINPTIKLDKQKGGK